MLLSDVEDGPERFCSPSLCHKSPSWFGPPDEVGVARAGRQPVAVR